MIFTVLALALAAPADPDVVHATVQQILYDVQDGKDFAQGQFKGAVTTDTAVRLAALKDCRLDSVTRVKGDAMAIIHRRCDGALGNPATMVTFEAGKVTSIDMASSVTVPVRSDQ